MNSILSQSTAITKRVVSAYYDGNNLTQILINPKDNRKTSFGRMDNSKSIVSPKSKKSYEIERKKLIVQGIYKFNSEPENGIEFLIQNNILENTPESVSQFLKDEVRLSKFAIGNYLGDDQDFNIAVLQQFVKLHNFTDVFIVDSLRKFLWNVRLPYRDQHKVDRMIQSFAKHYVESNPDSFTETNTCFLLSFALITLNTHLHHTCIKERPTLEQFTQLIKDIDEKRPMDNSFITALYISVSGEPFHLTYQDGNEIMLTRFYPTIEGWLWKRNARFTTWKKKWFILNNNSLYYFNSNNEKEARGIISLENIYAARSIESGKEFCLTFFKNQRIPTNVEYIKSIRRSSSEKLPPSIQVLKPLHSSSHVEKRTKYLLSAQTKEDRERWISAINQNSSFNSFYTTLAEKKNQLEQKDNPELTLKLFNTPWMSIAMAK